MLGIWSRKCS